MELEEYLFTDTFSNDEKMLLSDYTDCSNKEFKRLLDESYSYVKSYQDLIDDICKKYSPIELDELEAKGMLTGLDELYKMLTECRLQHFALSTIYYYRTGKKLYKFV